MCFLIMLFGLELSPFFEAIAEVESENGTTSANRYQITQICRQDVNNIVNKSVGNVWYNEGDVISDKRSREMMIIYWSYYGARYRKATGKPVSYEVLARIHNGGPNGFRKPETVVYWKKVHKHLKARGVKCK